MLKFAVAQRRAWHFLRNGDTSPLGDTTQRFLFFSAVDGLHMVAKKCAEQISFLSSGAECQGCGLRDEPLKP